MTLDPHRRPPPLPPISDEDLVATLRWQAECGGQNMTLTTATVLRLLDMIEHRYVTKSGRVLTDSDIEALADEAEQGYDVSHLVDKPPRRRWHTYVSTAWGWGAIQVDTAPTGWRCPICFTVEKHTKASSRTGRHFYPFSIACTECARAAWITNQHLTHRDG